MVEYYDLIRKFLCIRLILKKERKKVAKLGEKWYNNHIYKKKKVVWVRLKFRGYENLWICVAALLSSVLILVLALAFSNHTPAVGVMLPQDVVRKTNHRMIARKDGFYLFSSDPQHLESPKTTALELDQNGKIVTSGGAPVQKEISAWYPRMFLNNEKILAWGRTTDDNNLEGRTCLAVFDLTADSLSTWGDHVFQTESGQKLPLKEDDRGYLVTVDEQEVFYGIESNFEMLVSLPLSAIENQEIVENLHYFSLDAAGDDFVLSDISASPDGGLYLLGFDWSTTHHVLWWMDTTQENPEDTLVLLEESEDELAFPSEFLSEVCAIGSDGNLYTVDEEHRLTLFLEYMEEPYTAATVNLSSENSVLVKIDKNTINEYEIGKTTAKAQYLFAIDAEILTFASNGDTLVLVTSPAGYSCILLSELRGEKPTEPTDPPVVPSASPSKPVESSQPGESSASSSEVLSEPAGEDPSSSTPSSEPVSSAPPESSSPSDPSSTPAESVPEATTDDL